MFYATLDAVKKMQGLEGVDADDARLEMLVQWATSHIEFHKGRFYEPRIETRLYDLPRNSVSSFGVFESSFLPGRPVPPLRLDDDLLEVHELLNGDGEEISASDYVLEPANQTPKTRIRLINGRTWSAGASGRWQQVIALTGVFGSHDRYGQAWKPSGKTVQNNPLDESETSISVASIAGFEVGQLLRIEDEYVLLLGIHTHEEPTAYSLTVDRGANGSTPAEHAQGAPITIWQVQGNIAQACARLVKWRYAQKDVDTFDKTYFVEMGMVSVPTAIPTDVLALLGARKVRL